MKDYDLNALAFNPNVIAAWDEIVNRSESRTPAATGGKNSISGIRKRLVPIRDALREAVRKHWIEIPELVSLNHYISAFWQGHPNGALLKSHNWIYAAPDRDLTNGRLQMTFCPNGDVRSEYVCYKITQPERHFHIQEISKQVQQKSWIKQFRRGCEFLPTDFQLHCTCGNSEEITSPLLEVTEDQWQSLLQNGIDCNNYFSISRDRHRSTLMSFSVDELAQLLLSDFNMLKGLYLLLQGIEDKFKKNLPLPVNAAVKKRLGQVVPKPFTPEFAGETTSYSITEPIKGSSDHGKVVNALAKLLESKMLQVGKDQQRDLYIVDERNRISRLFEVKTDVSPYFIYAAVGQLLMHSIALSKRVGRVLIVPEEPRQQTFDILNKLKIDVVIYRIKNRGIKFIGLEDLLAD